MTDFCNAPVTLWWRYQ